ncbi:hypothetical protein ACOYR1_01150 [Thalassotalea piscium]
MNLNCAKFIACILCFLIIYSSSAFAANNTISLSIEAVGDTDASLLLLPVPNNTIPLHSNLRIKYKDIVINAKFHLVTLWPTTDGESYIRTLLIDAADLKGFTGQLLFVWSTTPNKNMPSKNVKNSNLLSVEQLRLLTKTNTRKPRLVYPSQPWLRQSLLLHPLNQRYETDWYVLPQQKYAHFVTNKATLLQKGYPPEKTAQWLYDRPQAIYQLFIMTEDKQWLNKGNELTDFYKQHIDENGQFDLTKRFDPKYLMPKGLAYQYLLNADATSLTTLKKIFKSSLGWDEEYSLSRGFWTERNQAAALNVAVTYWELTNDKQALNRINDIINATVAMTFNPESDWPVRGCPQHGFKSHEGWGDDTAACSPWMMALLGDALWRYYRLTGDEKSASLLDAFGDFILNHGIYFGDKRVHNIVIPKYIVSIDNQEQEELNQWSDPQHACDVGALLGKSVYIKTLKNEDAFLVKELFRSLVKQCKGSYHKLITEKKATEYWPLMPPRRFGWMYSSTSDLPWLVGRLLEN